MIGGKPRAAGVVLAELALVVACLAVSGCPAANKSPSEASTGSPEIFSLKVDHKTLLTYYDQDQKRFRTVAEINAIPKTCRGWVRVVDLSGAERRGIDPAVVIVADLQREAEAEIYQGARIARKRFENIARLRGCAADLSMLKNSSSQAGSQQIEVIVYGANWCPPCAQAKQWLREHGIRFQEKDIAKDGLSAEIRARIERDLDRQQQRQEPIDRAAKRGQRSDGQRGEINPGNQDSLVLPVIEIGDDVMFGYDPKKMLKLLRRHGINVSN